VRVSLKYNS